MWLVLIYLILTAVIYFQKGCLDMIKRVMIVSLLFALILFVYFVVSDSGVVLAPILLGLLVSFTCAMMLLTKK